eukprot:COSAG05_NODE_812_length_7171_cov_13.392534_6_plen_92_part_00
MCPAGNALTGLRGLARCGYLALFMCLSLPSLTCDGPFSLLSWLLLLPFCPTFVVFLNACLAVQDPNVDPPVLSWNRESWFPQWAAEHRACR